MILMTTLTAEEEEEEEEEGYSSTQKNTGNKIMVTFFVKIKIPCNE